MTLKDALKKHFGFSAFRAGQEKIITSILNGDNVLAVMPTGGGKSLCYQLPALISEGFSIVISPLIALMKDQVDALNKENEIAAFINSTMEYREAEHVLTGIYEGRIKILYVAPERLSNMHFAEKIKNLRPSFLFVDEAHCISEWGHNFRPTYRKIKEFAQFTGIQKISAFTATATPEVVHDIVEQLGVSEPKIFVFGFERDNISINVFSVKEKRSKLLEAIHKYGTPAIIYTSSRKKTEEVFEFLRLNKISCGYYHAGQNAVIRKHTQEDFLEGRIKIIVATNAFGMGIDKKDIRLVVHYNMPGTIENYYQEIGRAGRDGKESAAVLLFDRNDISIQQYFLANSYPDKELLRKFYDAICDYSGIALGSTSDGEIPINYEYISSYVQKEVTKALATAMLNILEESGYVRQVPELSKKYSYRFITDLSSLKNYVKNISDHNKKLLVLTLLREYGSSAFSKQVYFSLADLSIQTGRSEPEMENTLKELHNAGILDLIIPTTGEDTVILSSPRVQSERLIIDFERLSRNFIHASKKLELMTNYIYTKECRFKYILNYFGEDTTSYRCRKCDICTSPNTGSDTTAEYLREIVLRTVAHFPDGITESNCINILTGKTKSAAFRNSPTFSSLAVFTSQEISSIINSLKPSGYLKNSTRKKNTLQVTNKAIKALEEKGFIEKKESVVNHEENIEMFHLLREARTKAANRFTQPAYIICSDEILSEIVRTRPTTKLQLLRIPGFNERMYNKVGEQFLEIVKSFIDMPFEQRENNSQKQQVMPASLKETAEYVSKGYSFKEIAKLLKLDEPVIAMQIESIIEYMPEINTSKLISLQIIEKLEPHVATGMRDLKELKKRVPSEVSFPELRVAIAIINSKKVLMGRIKEN